jgi:hypothetical protein
VRRRRPKINLASLCEKEHRELTDLKYPMVDLFTGHTMMPLMYLNALTAWHLLLLTSPWLFMQAWLKELESERAS